MARKPNYRFERKERDRRKAEKKAAKQKAKTEGTEGAEGAEGADPNHQPSEDASDGQGRVAEDGGTQTDQTHHGELRVDGDAKA
jgi:hypothetical protein